MQRVTIAKLPDAWGGRTAVNWVNRIAANPSYDPGREGVIQVAETLDGIYER